MSGCLRQAWVKFAFLSPRVLFSLPWEWQSAGAFPALPRWSWRTAGRCCHPRSRQWWAPSALQSAPAKAITSSGLHSRGAGQADGQEGMIRRVCAKAAPCIQMLPGITAPTGWSQRKSPLCHPRRPKCWSFPWKRTHWHLCHVVRLRLRDSAPDTK